MQLLHLVILSIILLTILVIIFILFIDDILRTVNQFCYSCQRFIGERSGLFKIVFTLLFFVEQAAFLYILHKYFEISKKANTFIGIFALIVVVTASFQAFVWEYKYALTEREKSAFKNTVNKLMKYTHWTERWLSKRDKLKKK